MKWLRWLIWRVRWWRWFYLSGPHWVVLAQVNDQTRENLLDRWLAKEPPDPDGAFPTRRERS